MDAIQTSSNALAQDIFVDDSTYDQSMDRVEFEHLPTLVIKGRSESQSVFRALHEHQIDTRRVASSELFGRSEERTQLADAIQKLVRGQDSFVLIEGEAGIGKSKLVLDLVRQAASLEVPVRNGSGYSVERANSLSCLAWHCPAHFRNKRVRRKCDSARKGVGLPGLKQGVVATGAASERSTPN